MFDLADIFNNNLLIFFIGFNVLINRRLNIFSNL